MAIRYRVNVLEKLKAAGYSQNRIRNEKLLGVSVVSKIRAGGLPSWHELDVICRLLKCQPGDLIEYVDDKPEIETVEAEDDDGDETSVEDIYRRYAGDNNNDSI